MLGLSPLHPNDTEQKVYIPEGYHNGNGYVKTNSVYGLSEKTVTIPEGYHNGSGYVTVKALSGEIDVTSQATSWTKTETSVEEGPNGRPIHVTKTITYYGIKNGAAKANYVFYLDKQYNSYVMKGDGSASSPSTSSPYTITIQADPNGTASVCTGNSNSLYGIYPSVSKIVRKLS